MKIGNMLRWIQENHYRIDAPLRIPGKHIRQEPLEGASVTYTLLEEFPVSHIPHHLTEVNWQSPLELRKAVQLMATCFRREGRFDFIPYRYNERDGWQDVHFLFDRSDCYVGACSFRLIEDSYNLSWIWIHPYERGKGLLADAWTYFKWRFPNFYPDPPYSKAMRAFLEKHP